MTTRTGEVHEHRRGHGAARRPGPGHPDREWFFEDQPGRQYSPAWLIAGYHRCRELAGGIAPASTPYTLRHNHATRTLMRWVEEGKDIEAWLPYLAAYLGHQKYSSTAWYVHLLPVSAGGARTVVDRRQTPGKPADGTIMSALAPTLQAFFTDRLAAQRRASGRTVTAYRDALRLLICFVCTRTGKQPSRLDFADLDAATVGAFLSYLEQERGNTVRTRNARLAAIHALFRYAALRHPEHAASIGRVLSIPAKSFDRALVSYLTRADAGLALGRAPFTESTEDDELRVLHTNVDGVLRITRLALPHVRDGGHIVFMGSVAGRQAYPNGASYIASKFAVRGFSYALREDLLGRPVRITTVDAGLVETEFSVVRFRGDENAAAAVYEGVDPVTPDEVADCVMFALTRPLHVNLDEIVIKALQSSGARVVRRTTE